MSIFASHLHGDNLIKEIEIAKPKEPLIEGILYKKSAHMIFAPDGIGKSQVILQMCMEGTRKGNYLFGSFFVPEGFKVIYIQTERHQCENLERMKRMMVRTNFDPQNFILEPRLQGINIQSTKEDVIEGTIDFLRSVLSQTMKYVDLIVIDPIYAICRSSLNTDEGAAAINVFSTRLQNAFDCSTLMVHHSNRGVKTETGSRVGMDMAGSRFLSAHCTGVMQLKKNDKGTTLCVEKSTNQNLETNIKLWYDPETGCSMVEEAETQKGKGAKLMTFLRNTKKLNKTFDIDEMLAVSKLSPSGLYKHLSGDLATQLEVISISSHGKKLYRFLG